MSTVKTLSAVGLCLAIGMGCSAKTKEEAKEALDATGEAVGAAAEDAKVNAKKVGEVFEAGAEKAKEKFSDPPPSVGTDDPSDADAVPESQEIAR